MSKKIILLGLLLLSISITSLVSAHENSGDKPHTDSTAQTCSDKKDSDKDSEKDCCKEKHEHEDKESK